jgi:hypothetical protein
MFEEEDIKKYASKIRELGDKARELCDDDHDEAQLLLELTTYIHRNVLSKEKECVENILKNAELN